MSCHDDVKEMTQENSSEPIPILRATSSEEKRELPEYILQAALREGYIPHRDDKFLIHGSGGVGKSSLIAMFLGMQRDLVRVSTPVAKTPFHVAPIRDVSTSTFTANWERVGYERLSENIVHTSNMLFLSKKKKGEEGGNGNAEEGTGYGARSQVGLAVQSKKSSRSRFLSKLSHFFRPKQQLTTTLEDDPDNIQELFSNFLQGLQEKVRNAKEMNEVILSHSIRIVDSGGQPQFLELIAIFLAHISGFVSVFKLSEALSEHGEVVLYDDGQPVNEPYESHYSHEQAIRHSLQAIQSEAMKPSGMEEMPNLAFVGTFLDQQDMCPETPDQKDERLHSIITEILPEEMQECVITSGSSLRKATFQINARCPMKEDYERVDQLKKALISRSQSKTMNLPLKWHGLEVVLHMLMEKLQRHSLSRKECEFIAHKLGFDRASLKAALEYLRQLNIIAYYDELPDVIFGSSQVIFDKISDLVRHSLELKKGQGALSGAERKFVQQGIVSLEFLRTPALSKHYVPQLFEAEDLLKVLISQLVLFPVSAKEFLMPCVLEVSSIWPSPPIPEGNMRSSFILHFSKKSPMFGVYCCTISSLISVSGWKLLTEHGDMVQVARNSFTFDVPMDLPGKLTFLDPISSYLEVVLELPVSIAARHSGTLFPSVRDEFFSAIEKAMETLHYDVQLPEVSFLCPEQSHRCSVMPHPAMVNESQSYLKCSLRPSSVYFPLTVEQKKWLPNVTGVSQLSSTQGQCTLHPPALPPNTAQGRSSPESPSPRASPRATRKTVPSTASSTQALSGPSIAEVVQATSMSNDAIENLIDQLLDKMDTNAEAKKGGESVKSLKEADSDNSQFVVPSPSMDLTPPSQSTCTSTSGMTSSSRRAECPSLPELLYFPTHTGDTINIVKVIGSEYDLFGIVLLNDADGSIVEMISDDCHHRPEKIAMEILKRWIRGGGKQPKTWGTLIDTFCNIGMTELASRIDMSL